MNIKIFTEHNVYIAFIVFNAIFALLSLALIGLGLGYREVLPYLKLCILNSNFDQLPVLVIVVGVVSLLATIPSFLFVKNGSKFTNFFLGIFAVLIAFHLILSIMAFLSFEMGEINETRKQLKEKIL